MAVSDGEATSGLNFGGDTAGDPLDSFRTPLSPGSPGGTGGPGDLDSDLRLLE